MLEANKRKTAIYQNDPVINEILSLMYTERNYDLAMKAVKKSIRPYSLEYDFFTSRILGNKGKFMLSVKINDAMVLSDHLEELFYLFEDADDRLTLDLVNIGNDLRMRHYTEKSGGVRRLGSAALDLAYVAAGRIDGTWLTGLHSWDMAAGGLIVREAGGLLNDFEGGDNWMENGEVIAATPRIHHQMLEVMKPLSDARRKMPKRRQ